ncbi:conserved repeat domain-containing protein, partial [Algoriphagus hitonicola]
SVTVTATYTITQEDLNAGSVTNTASASTTYGSNTVTSDTDNKTANADQTPAIKLTKTAEPSEYYTAGEEIEYTFVVTNKGNVTLYNVVVYDETLEVEIGTLVSLAPGASEIFKYTYTTTEADLSNGSFTNTATATGDYTDAEGMAQSVSDSDEATITAVYDPSISITKTGQYEDSNGDGFYTIGDRVNYEFVVANTGNVDLLDVVVTDLNPAVVIENGGVIGTLTVGQTVTLMGYYEITEAELISGTFVNTATATGYFNDQPYTDSDDDTQDFKIVDLKVTKTAVAVNGKEDPLTYSKVGDVITYTITVENIGNWPINRNLMQVLDPLATTGPTYVPLNGEMNPPVLQPGEIWTYTATYVITEADLVEGSFTNTAFVKVISGNEEYEFSDDETVNVTPMPELTLTKESDLEGMYVLGEKIEYTFVVTNTGNVPLTNVTVSDPLFDLSFGPIAELAAGASATYTYIYTVTQADVDAGSIVNTATASGYFGNDEYTDEATETVYTEQTPSIALTKTSDVEEGEFYVLDQEIEYTFVVTNDGNVTLTDVTVSDPLFDLSFGPFTLAPGTSATYTYTYTVTQADVDAGSIVNTATASGYFGSDEYTEEATATVYAELTPALSIAKSITLGGTYMEVGDVVEYSYVITNSGNVE